MTQPAPYAPLDDGGPPPPPPRPTLAERLRAAPVTYALIAIDVAVFLWAESHGRTTDVGTLIRFGASERVLVRSGDYWRLVTPMFMHVGWIHLAWNSYAGFGWCAAVERVLGPRRFALAYLLAGVGGVCGSVIGHDVPSAGASGALFGIIGATLVLRRRMLGSWKALAEDPPTRGVLGNIALWTAIGFTMNIDNFAHFGGLVTGAAVAWITTTKPPRTLSWGVFGVGFAGLLLAAAQPWWRPSAADTEWLLAYGASYADGSSSFPRDPARAAKFFRLACEAGSEEGCAAAKQP